MFDRVVLPVLNVYVVSIKEKSFRSTDKFVVSGYQIVQTDLFDGIKRRCQLISSNHYVKDTFKSWVTKDVSLLFDLLMFKVFHWTRQ